MEIQIKHAVTAAVLFTYTADANSIAMTLSEAVKNGAYLRGANLGGAYLGGAYLGGVNLRDAYLGGANLGGAYLGGAYLGGANLGGAYLGGVNLRGAYLRDANLGGANLRGAKNFVFQIVPQEGSFIGWKKLKNGVIAKLEIPAEAKRNSTPVGRKNRAEFVKVLELFESRGATEAVSMHDNRTVYRVGEIVRPDSYNDDIRLECTNGIHFFIAREEAEAYN